MFGCTPLHCAAYSNERLEAAAALLEYKVDAALRNKHGQTALELAEAKGSDAVAQLLRDHAAGLAAAPAQPAPESAPAPAPATQPAAEEGVPPPEQAVLGQLVAMMACPPAAAAAALAACGDDVAQAAEMLLAQPAAGSVEPRAQPAHQDDDDGPARSGGDSKGARAHRGAGGVYQANGSGRWRADPRPPLLQHQRRTPA